MAKDRANLFRNIRQARSEENRADSTELNETVETENSQTTEATESLKTDNSSPIKKTRGRPATGKRSDPDWIGRTYYIRRETDLDISGELLELKRKGIEIDKSELVDSLLAAWVKWRNGDNSEILLAEISPSRKDSK